MSSASAELSLESPSLRDSGKSTVVVKCEVDHGSVTGIAIVDREPASAAASAAHARHRTERSRAAISRAPSTSRRPRPAGRFVWSFFPQKLCTVIHFYVGADLISVISVQAFFT